MACGLLVQPTLISICYDQWNWNDAHLPLFSILHPIIRVNTRWNTHGHVKQLALDYGYRCPRCMLVLYQTNDMIMLESTQYRNHPTEVRTQDDIATNPIISAPIVAGCNWKATSEISDVSRDLERATSMSEMMLHHVLLLYFCHSR